MENSGVRLMVCKEDSEGIVLICKDMEGVVPTEIQVIPHGYHDTPKGAFLGDEKSQELVMKAFEGRVNDMVIDYEHQTLSGKEAPAAGWIKKLVNKGKDGIWAVVDWTEKAKGYIANKEYRYVSPVFFVKNDDRRAMFLVNVALTNQPNIDGMVPLINKQSVNINQKHKEEKSMKWLDALLASLGLTKESNEAAAQAVINKFKEGGKVLANKDLLGALDLKEDSSAESVIAGVLGLKAGGSVIANKAVLDALGLQGGAGEADVVGTIMAMKQSHDKVGELSTQVAALIAKTAKGEAETMVNKAMGEGKIAPAQKDWALEYARKSPKEFEVFISKAPVVVSPGQFAQGETPPADENINDLTLMVAKQFGNTKEDLEKYGSPQ